ncbi:MAG: hypothetical protein Q4A60_03440 [Pasteurellaceae bacterium]|nr:hypothetical protein [Pasteurellaceae bacterium]
MSKLLTLFIICIISLPLWAGLPIKSIDIYVLPYYSAQNGKAELVNVHPEIDPLLLKNTVDDYKQAVEIVKKEASYITPVTLLALAARAYDLGLRDEAVFWFYVGRKRLLVLDHVAALPTMLMAEFSGFVQLTRVPILAYAFCDTQKQEQILSDAYEWTKKHPYFMLLDPNVPSKFQDRQEGLKDAQKMLDKRQQEQKTAFSDPKMKEKIKQSRKENDLDSQFCW